LPRANPRTFGFFGSGVRRAREERAKTLASADARISRWQQRYRIDSETLSLVQRMRGGSDAIARRSLIRQSMHLSVGETVLNLFFGLYRRYRAYEIDRETTAALHDKSAAEKRYRRDLGFAVGAALGRSPRYRRKLMQEMAS
jgi:hypothetical protein